MGARQRPLCGPDLAAIELGDKGEQRYVAAWMWAARVETAAASASSSMVVRSSDGAGCDVVMEPQRNVVGKLALNYI